MSKQSKEKHNIKQVLSNNWFILKICFIAAPLYMVVYIYEVIRNQVFIFFEHTYGIGFVLEAVEYGRPFRDVVQYVVILFLVGCISMLINGWIYQIVAEKGLVKIKQRLKMMLYEKAGKLDLKCYDDPEYYNNLVLAVSEAEKQIGRMIEFLDKLFSGVTILITTGLYFLAKDKVSVFFVVVSFFLSFGFSQMFNRLSYKIRMEKNPKERKRAYIHRVFYLNEYAKELRLNPHSGDKIMEDFKEVNDTIYDIDKSYARKKFVLSFVKNYLCNDFISDVLYISYLVYKAAVMRVISYSNVVILFHSSGRLKRSLHTFTEIYPYANETSLYVEKIKEFLNSKPQITSEKNLSVPEEVATLELHNVSFAYSQKEGNIINNLSLTIHPGEKIALVGYNGAGKTTLIKLIMRLYDVTEGYITLNNVNIRDYNVEKYREYIGTVFQDFMVYGASVMENVAMDKTEGVEESSILDALDKSGFAQRLETLPEGLNTQLTTEFDENGVNLSGGEAQKLAISRVFYRNANLMILDEPSSALDPIAEYQLNRAMLLAGEKKNVIFISHRLSTTRLADKIFMLEQGRIVEEGNHQELLERDGKYANMWRVQAGQYLEQEMLLR